MGLLLGFLFYSIDPSVCFCANTTMFWLLVALWYCLKSGVVVMPPALFFFLRISLEILGLLWFPINFRIIYSNSVKNVLGKTSIFFKCFPDAVNAQTRWRSHVLSGSLYPQWTSWLWDWGQTWSDSFSSTLLPFSLCMVAHLALGWS